MNKIRLGIAFCGSFCTHEKILFELKKLCEEYDVVPIFSESAATEDTRFGTAADRIRTVEELTGVKGIGPATLDGLRDYVTVGAPTK